MDFIILLPEQGTVEHSKNPLKSETVFPEIGQILVLIPFKVSFDDRLTPMFLTCTL